ncbi:mRNA cap guanine-N7 methyltransferase [Chytriomyces hyalinus]|nr:mRNA cap guanine-N7 methyltransferase [Chytriomyces hyalinus]
MLNTAATVASHYNARPQVGVEERKESTILQLKNLHNWIKSVLIRKFVRRGDTVLDFCCGKGGDLNKWMKADIGHLTGADIASVSIEHAVERCRERNPRFSAKFFTMDCFVAPIESIMTPYSADLVSCQFALHYCAESEEKFDRALDNIALSLKPGGYFIATIPNCYRLMQKLNSSDSLSFGNSKYNVRFETKDHPSIYGHKYWFQLEDAIDDCPEFVFHFPTFVRKAAERGLDLVYEKPFHDLFNEEIRDEENCALMYRMRVLDDNGTISADEWEVSGVYMAVALKKRNK